MVSDIIVTSWDACNRAIIEERPFIRMSPPVLEAADVLREFLFERVYHPRSAQPEAKEAEETVRFLYRYYTTHEREMPKEYRRLQDSTARSVVDYIAGMTDQYALRLAGELKG